MLSFLKSFSSNVYSNYSVQSHAAFEAGCWEVFDAKNKSTGEAASVFVLNKKKVHEQLGASGLRPRTAPAREVAEFAARGVTQLTRMRHPAVLRVVEPLEQGKNSLVFATERVSGTLERAADLDGLAVVRGLTTLVQALQFMHQQLGLCHLNVAPRSVFVDQQGDWKLAGLEFAASFADAQPNAFQLPILDPRMPACVHPAYDFLAPELVLDRTATPANDVWGLACVIYTVFCRRPPLKVQSGSPSAYRDALHQFEQQLPATAAAKLPAALQPYVQSLFCRDPSGRISLEVLETTPFFQDPLIKALRAMDDFSAKPVEEKVSFLKHFATLLPQFPKQMRTRKIVKFAARELAGPRDPATAQLLGNVLFACSADMSRLGFQEQVLPVFAPLTDYLPFQESVFANVAIVARNTNDKDFSKSVLPLILDALKHHDAQHAPLQARVLSDAHLYGDNLTVSKMEKQLFPAVVDCFAATPARAVKVAATQCLAVLVHRDVSKQLITDRLIPALRAMKTRDPLVVAAVASLWNDVCGRLNSEQIFGAAVPHLLEIALARQLTVDQFKAIMAVVSKQIDAVAKDQIKLLVHNEPQQEDDWLNEPPTAAPAAPAVLTAGATATATVPATVPAPAAAATAPATAATAATAPVAPSKPTSVPVLSVPVLNRKPDPLPKTPDSVLTAQKIKAATAAAASAQKPAINTAQPLTPAPALASPSFPALQPLKPGATGIDAMLPLVPTRPDDEFGSFVSTTSTSTAPPSSSSQASASGGTNFDSLL